jgi:hypothetical protein
MDAIAVRISGPVSASIGNARVVVPSADYYARQTPGAVDTAGGFGTSDVPPLPVWKLRAMDPGSAAPGVEEFDLTDRELSQYVVGGEITMLEDICP